jgi:Rhodopirellula transposase DDE domain
MEKTSLVVAVREKYELLRAIMNERMRRQWAASEALSLARGGVTVVAQATGLSRTTITAGVRELRTQADLPPEEVCPERIRGPGGGRHALVTADPTLIQDLEALVEPATRGDPQCLLRWTSKSTRKLAEELNRQGHPVSYVTVAALLHDLEYSLQANRKTREGQGHPDRDAQFEHIDKQVRAFQREGQPVISVDSTKRELIGDFKNGGQEWRPRGSPEKVKVYDYPDKELGKVTPGGVYDVTVNEGWVSVGIDHNTAQFAAETIRRWWQAMGLKVYPAARKLLVTADSGGSNARRCRLWKVALQDVADALGLAISVCHFPPGTSKWNKIEHRMFCHITENWRGRPLRSRATVVNLIGNTTTTTGLHLEAALDGNSYPIGIEVSDEELAAVRIRRHPFHGEWNYTISPSKQP